MILSCTPMARSDGIIPLALWHEGSIGLWTPQWVFNNYGTLWQDGLMFAPATWHYFFLSSLRELVREQI